MRHMHLSHYITFITTDYDELNLPTFTDMVVSKDGSETIPVVRSIQLFDDDFDINSIEELDDAIKQTLITHSTNDHIHYATETLNNDIEVNDDIERYHANLIESHTGVGKGNTIIDNRFMTYMEPTLTKSGMRVFSKDGKYALVIIDDVSKEVVFGDYFRMLSS